MCIAYCILFSVYSILYTVQCMLCSVRCVLYIVCCILSSPIIFNRFLSFSSVLSLLFLPLHLFRFLRMAPFIFCSFISWFVFSFRSCSSLHFLAFLVLSFSFASFISSAFPFLSCPSRSLHVLFAFFLFLFSVSFLPYLPFHVFGPVLSLLFSRLALHVSVAAS